MSQPEATITSPQSHAGASEASRYEPCQECGAPLDRQQRYCINCGARRGDAANPTARYFAAASRRRRALAARPAEKRNVASRAAVVGFLVLLPIAVAAGVLVGRSGMHSDDGAVQQALQALRNQPATAAAPSDSGTSTPVSDASSKLLPSDWSLDQGYTVKLDLLPIAGTDEAAAAQAKKDAGSKGAKDVGIISPKDYATTPDQGAKDYVLYSGEFKSKADATKTLGGLKKSFPQAQVIEVQAAGTGGGGDINSKVVAHTSHGTVHSVTGFKPTQQQIQQDTKTVQGLQKKTGHSYLKAEKALGDITVVGGNPNNAPPLPTGNGD